MVVKVNYQYKLPVIGNEYLIVEHHNVISDRSFYAFKPVPKILNNPHLFVEHNCEQTRYHGIRQVKKIYECKDGYIHIMLSKEIIRT